MQHLPWENMPVLINHCMTRMPSVQFLFAHWKSLIDDAASVVNVGINRRSVFYVINPDGDLMNTQKSFGTWFNRFASANMASNISFCLLDVVLALKRRNKGSSALSIRSLMIHREDEDRPLVGVIALSFFQRLDTVGWVIRRVFSP